MTDDTASVILATLDELANIDHVLETALASDSVVEVVVADGGSSDGTPERVKQRMATDPRVKLIHNPDVVQSAGLNRAAQIASGTILIRLDAHTRYAPDYIAASLAAWKPGVAVGGPMVADGEGQWSVATANAMSDPLAIGPARFHHAASVEKVDTVYLGTFERRAFIDIGGYRTFPSGVVEDTDFYARWRSQGGEVLVDPSVRSWYHPRATWPSLARQYFRYGWGKAELLLVNRRLPSLRPLPPALLVAAIMVSGIAAAFGAAMPLIATLFLWLGTIAVVAARAPSRRIRTGIVAATMHAAYGCGFWRGLIGGAPTIVEHRWLPPGQHA